MSRNAQSQDNWDHLIHVLNICIEADPILTKPAQSSMTAQQADALYSVLTMLTHSVGNIRVIRQQQSSKSQLRRIQ